MKPEEEAQVIHRCVLVGLEPAKQRNLDKGAFKWRPISVFWELCSTLKNVCIRVVYSECLLHLFTFSPTLSCLFSWPSPPLLISPFLEFKNQISPHPPVNDWRTRPARPLLQSVCFFEWVCNASFAQQSNKGDLHYNRSSAAPDPDQHPWSRSINSMHLSTNSDWLGTQCKMIKIGVFSEHLRWLDILTSHLQDWDQIKIRNTPARVRCVS